MAIIVTAGAGDTCCIMGQRHIQTINKERERENGPLVGKTEMQLHRDAGNETFPLNVQLTFKQLSLHASLC